jgi:hypothetical protein
MLDSIKDAFINRVLGKLLDGNTGSNILGVLITAVIAAHIDYVKAFAGFQFNNSDNAMESAKLVGTVITAIFAYFVGKKK